MSDAVITPQPRAVGSPSRRRLSAIALSLTLLGAFLFAGAPEAAAAPVKTIKQSDCAKGCTIPAGEIWQFDPDRSQTITSTANIVVRGTLRMRPASAKVVHTLVFKGIDESKFKGGGAKVVASDVGLWVMGAGKLDIRGTPRKAWAYNWKSGWKAADNIVAAPHTPGRYGFTQVDRAADVPQPNAAGYKTELLNLTRNVRIRGTAAGKSHIFIKSSRPQVIKYAELRYMSPDFLDLDPRTGRTDDRTGRYALHFHMSGKGSVGSVVEGVVVRNADGHAFVPHGSHGVTFKNTIAYKTRGEAYWWDESTGDTCPAGKADCNASHNIRYICAVAAGTTTHSAGKHTGAAFQMGAGLNNSVTRSVAVGMRAGGKDNAGFKWPSKDHGVWHFVANRAHNNQAGGIFVWHNTSGAAKQNHVIDGFHAFYNAGAGIDHGAYNNSYVYKNVKLRGNKGPAIVSHALGKKSAATAAAKGATDTQQWLSVDAGNGVLSPQSHKPSDSTKPVRFVNCRFGAVQFAETGKPGRYDFVNCGLEMADFKRAGINAGTIVRVQDGGTAYKLKGKGAVVEIAPFFKGSTKPPPPPDPKPPKPVKLP